MQTEHGLRPVKIDFISGIMSSHIKRLKGDHPKLARNRPRRGRLSQVSFIFKLIAIQILVLFNTHSHSYLTFPL